MTTAGPTPPRSVSIVEPLPGSEMDPLFKEPARLARVLRSVADWIETKEPAPQHEGARRAVISGDPDPFMDLDRLAVYLDVSRGTVEKFINLPPEQALPCYRLRGKVLVRKSEADAFMEQFRSRGRPSLTRALRELGLYTDEEDA